ncbi:hypothetical protein FJU31_09030 [Stenotrophomonas cyclobalanopsidis]|uniref:Uncharacterized protein n=1 Tax=Stenotrophomonas cyclobalanopsidis TaxID=2771362 RepID=A0ABQ6T1K7_9GAMM|nr:hypothetical protein [Stenotrophomonas cyclobalanopsidis]KAA8999117.1 hypothetical protein FJU31_09030 [Stenotrophomonas cyclobalanopsidis]
MPRKPPLPKTKQTLGNAPFSSYTNVITPTTKTKAVRVVKFGSAHVSSGGVDARTIQQGRAESRRALNALGRALIHPGVEVTAHPGVPYYSADPQHPGVIIRVLDGKQAQGRFVDGKFQEIAA